MSGFKGKNHSRLGGRKHLDELDKYEDGELFDLMPVDQKCDTFRVAFDYYSPRSHFIIVPRDRKSITSFNSLDQGAKLKAVRAAMSMVSHYELHQLAIFSLHFGKWGTNKDQFHGHLYVDVDEYLRIFEKRKNEIPNWPSGYVTGEWESENPEDYKSNVRRYPAKTYFKKEVKSVKEYRRTKPSTSTAGASATPSPPFTAIPYHPSEPRVGFAVKSERTRRAEAFLEAQEAIIKFASQKNLTNKDAKDDNDGCHVCLVLDGNTHG